ncbi:Bgt-3530 [Blumeria graminis f. sp. tritici]|uniref:Bgt-3530 n=1 Tax=Blumeria graminis f. sp. tritici TaxID=62690 RepID=A0A9X9MHG6_BLUGR|nr:Bgt-3530 [Blumeria graminis f. sp. tritici]
MRLWMDLCYWLSQSWMGIHTRGNRPLM